MADGEESYTVYDSPWELMALACATEEALRAMGSKVPFAEDYIREAARAPDPTGGLPFEEIHRLMNETLYLGAYTAIDHDEGWHVCSWKNEEWGRIWRKLTEPGNSRDDVETAVYCRVFQYIEEYSAEPCIETKCREVREELAGRGRSSEDCPLCYPKPPK